MGLYFSERKKGLTITVGWSNIVDLGLTPMTGLPYCLHSDFQGLKFDFYGRLNLRLIDFLQQSSSRQQTFQPMQGDSQHGQANNV